MNEALLVGLFAVFFAQFLKVPIMYFKKNVWDWKLFTSTGSMPSSHTAFVVAATISVGHIEGFGSTIFAVSTVFSMITIHDAVKVRGESGKQARVINELLNDVVELSTLLDNRITKYQRGNKLKELIGHTTSEVVGGLLLGIAIAEFYFLVIS